MRSLRNVILNRLRRGDIVINYSSDPEHTTKKELRGIVRGVAMQASEDDLFGALVALCNEGVVEKIIQEYPVSIYGSEPEPRLATKKTVTYMLVTR